MKFVQKVGSSWFSVEKYSPQRTRRARRKEDLTAKERKGFSFQISGLTALWTPLPRQEKAQSFNDKYLNLRTIMLEILPGLGKFSKIRNMSDSDIPPAEGPRTLSSDKYFFFAAPSTLLRTCFASLREIIRNSVAASPRGDLRGERNQGDSRRVRQDTSTGNQHG